MNKKLSIGTAIIIAGNLLFGLGSPAIGIHTSAVYAASEFGMTTYPAAGAAFINVGASLGLSFDRQVIPQTGKITITTQDTGAVFTEIAIGSSGLIGNSSSYEIKLGSGLRFAPFKTYSVSVPKGLFKDSAGNESSAASWNFTTAGENNPAIVASNFAPANNSRVDAGELTQLSLRLAGTLTGGGGSVKLLSSSDNTVIQEFVIRDGEPRVALQSDASSTAVTLTLANRLAAGGNYYVLIDSYAFKDANNTTFPGISSGNGWSFSTIGSDTVSVTTSPAGASSGASVSGAIKLNFDRPMNVASGTISVSPGTQSDSRTRWLNVNSTSVTGGGSPVITLLPASASTPLLNGTLYTVTIPQGAFYDQDGHVFPASGPYSWTFTTASQTSLSIASLSPADRSESVELSRAITLSFNREASYNSGVSNGVVLYKSNGTRVNTTVQQGATAKDFVIKPASALEPDTVYYIDIARGAFTDAGDPGSLYEGLSGTKAWSFRTAAVDKTAPLLTSSTLDNNRTIRLKYNETLNSSVSLLPSSFTVSVNDENRSIDSVYIQGENVYLVISTGIAVGQNVKVSYTAGVRTIQDTSGNAAASFSAVQVANSIESALPTPKEGRLTGRTVSLTFNDTLKTVSSYAKEQFIVTADGYSLGVNSISSSGNTVYMTVNSEAGNGVPVRVSYYPGSYPLLSSLGQNIANFTDFNIRNSNDTVAPLFQNASGSGTTLVLNYNEGLSESNLPMNSQFSVLVGNVPNYVTNVAVSGSSVKLTLQSALVAGQTVTVSYVPGVKGLTDLNGNRAAYVDLQPVSLSDVVVSSISSATVSGNELTVTFAQNMLTSSTLSTSQFAVRINGTNTLVQRYTLAGTVLKLLLAGAVTSGQTVDLSYTSSTSLIKDLNGNALASFSLLPVKNLTGAAAAAADANRPAYLGTLEASEFGEAVPLLKSDSSAVAADQSIYSQSIKRYSLNADRLTASYAYLNSQGTGQLLFEVPSAEVAAYITVPLQPLMDAYNRNKASAFGIRYGDQLFSVDLEKVDFNGIVSSLNTTSSNISLIYRIEKMPAEAFAPFAQRLQLQGLTNVTPLADLRLAASVTGNYTNEYALSLPGKYTVRTTSAINSAQTSVARLDQSYYDAAYLPTTISTKGSNTIMRALTGGNQIVGAFTSTRSFTDMSTHWSNTAVAELAAKNIIDSSYGSQFKPDQAVTRSEFAVMLSRGLGLPGDTVAAQRFSDIQSSSSVGGYIGAAAKAGVITGNTDGTFRPEDKITREQMAIMMVRAMESTGQPITLTASVADTLSMFKDRTKIQSQSTEFVAKAVKAGIIQGISATQFQPQGNATRAQGAMMLQRMLSKAGYL